MTTEGGVTMPLTECDFRVRLRKGSMTVVVKTKGATGKTVNIVKVVGKKLTPANALDAVRDVLATL